MRTAALQYLVCPRCAGTLVADAGTQAADGHIMDGTLISGCGARFAIRGGIARLIPESHERASSSHSGHSGETPDPESLLTADRFAAEWAIFDQKAGYYEQQFLDWIAPLRPRDFTDQVVLEGGCGKGRHTALVASYGARAVIAIDLGDAVEVAFDATRHLENVHIAQGDIVRPPVARCVDVGFSIGVLHHLLEPEAGFRGLCGCVRQGGRVAIWVYGYESNEWIVRYVDPLRHGVTSRIPETWLYWLSLPPAAALRLALLAYRRPRLAEKLPYGAYLAYISRFPLREVHHIMFDQLVTPVAHYLRRGQVAGWFDPDGFADVELAWHNRNSWRACATIDRQADQSADSSADSRRA